MKKYLFTILLGAFGAMAIAAPALAATSVSFAPVNVSLRPGQNFTLTIGLNPQGTKNYTAKMELRYPADLMEVKSFAFANGWLALVQPGYDLSDKTNGVLIKTAGYPGGVSSPVAFGTASFLAKKSGNGTITLNSANSLALDANNQNVIAGASAQTAVAVAAPATAPTTPKTQTIPAAEPTKKEPAVSEKEAPALTESTAAPQPIASRSLLAAVGSVAALGTGSAVVGILVGAIILILAGYAIYAVIKKRIRRPDSSNSTDSAQPKEPPPQAS